MKIETRVDDKTITIELPEGVAAMYAFATENRFSSGMHKVPAGQAIEMATDFFVRILEDAPDVGVAAALGNLRYRLMKAGIMSENVDMAVSFEGKVLPLDELGAEIDAAIDADIKKDH